jgi:uncharacterized protein
MKREFAPAGLDVRAFANAQASLSGEAPLATFPRLADEAVTPGEPDAVHWTATGEERADATGAEVPWVHLHAEAAIALTCQRCLAPVVEHLESDRWFRFAPDETVAAAEDELADEDVLALSREFDLLGLIEDELLMEIPVTPRHDVCPQPVVLSAQDPDFEAAQEEKAKPFAVLEALRTKKPE